MQDYKSLHAAIMICAALVIKFIGSKPKYKITQTKTIQLVSYGVKKVLKRHCYLPPPKKKEKKRKQIEKKKTTICSNRYRHTL